jgi:hypothetical protein
MFIFVYLVYNSYHNEMVSSNQRIVNIPPPNVHIKVLDMNPSLRYMNMLHRLKSLRATIRKRVKGRRLNRNMLYLMLNDIVCRMDWNDIAFVYFTDFINDIYNDVADIYRLCKVQKTTLVRYLAGYIGLDAVTRHVTGAGFRISALAH